MAAWIRLGLVVIILTTLFGVPATTGVVSAQTFVPQIGFDEKSPQEAAPALTTEQVNTFDCGTVSEIPLIECQALVELYSSTNGAGWLTSTNWLANNTPSTWYGVGIIDEHVKSIDLRTNNLHNNLPDSLIDLSQLQTLILEENYLTGSISPELGNLINLRYLRLSSNELTGSIPPELGNLTNLRDLSLSSNGLTGSIPANLGNLIQLQSLYLYTNQLTGSIPPELGNLTNLFSLSLSTNQLTGSIPTELGSLSQLRYLSLSHNQLSGSIPAELGSLTYLTTLNLNYNDLTGAVPESFTNLVNLCTPSTEYCYGFYGLDLSFNHLNTSGLSQTLLDFLAEKDPDWVDTQIAPFTSCAEITYIPLVECNALVDLYNATNGTGWHDHSYWLEANQPDFWKGVTVSGGHVIELSLSNNNLTGHLPASLGGLTNLRTIILGSNQLSGGIPPELGSLINLIYLDLGNNQFSGAIPPVLGSLTNLQQLYLYNNYLSGSIPVELGDLTNLQQLHLFENQLSGSIPPKLGNLSNLQTLALFGNQLSGTIPPELGNLVNLQRLTLFDNQLSGSIPPELSSLTNLVYLYLNNNNLSGDIPVELGTLSNLHYLELGGNQLSGTIPSALGNLTNLICLLLNDNQLNGTIPSQLGNLTNLRELRLQHNQLSGVIPTELGNLTNLYYLNLNNNQLSGAVPESFTNFVNLFDPSLPDFQYFGYGLNLNYNRLTTPATPQALADFLTLKNPGWELTQAASLTIGDDGGTLMPNDGLVIITFPGGSLPTGAVVTYVPRPYPTHGYNPLGFANLSFQLEVTLPVSINAVFDLPASVSISYTQDMLDHSFYHVKEDTLKLYWWDESSSTWTDAVNTCTPPGSTTLDTQANTLQLSICSSGEFALLGETSPMIFLPFIRR